jgi:hypothetical protein
MQTFTYPTSDLDDAKKLLTSLGTFWSRTYEAKDQMQTYAQAVSAAAAQNELSMLEAIAALSRYDVPIFHTENWYPLVLRKSQTNFTPANAFTFNNDQLVFDSGKQAKFNEFSGRDFFAFNAPENLAGAARIFDRLVFPNYELIGGVDFVVDTASQVIIFTEDPFTSDTVTKQPIYENEQLVDEEITLWAFKANFDYGYLFQQFAYAVNINLASSENAKALTNAVISGLILGGASDAAIVPALSAIFDVPLVKSDGEVVEVITLDNAGLLIVTDKHVYRFNADATPAVAVGAVVNTGAHLTGAVKFVDLNRGVAPDDLKALALDSGYTSGCFYSDLVFENKEVPLRVDTEHPSGYTYVSFPLAGFPNDVRRFFDEMHERGIQQIPTTPPECDLTGENRRLGTLAHILDRRPERVGEPDATSLPATINPLKFLIANVLRNNAAIVKVRISELGKNHLGLYNIRHVRQLLPPYSALFFFYELDGQKDRISGIFDVNEAIKRFKGVEPLQTAVAPILVKDKGVLVRTVSGTCQ